MGLIGKFNGFFHFAKLVFKAALSSCVNFSPFEELTSDTTQKADFRNELLGREEALLRCLQVAQQPEEHTVI